MMMVRSASVLSQRGVAMPLYTDEMIAELISCRKEVLVPPKRSLASQNGHKRNEMTLNSDARLFRVFMRISEAFEENFSIGMEYLPPSDSPLMLVRCNGPHGNVLGPGADPGHPHWGYHVHRATQASIEKGKKAEAGATLTDGYNSYEEALRFFLREVNVVDGLKHFSGFSQKTMF
jgi:hypothetical protein